jgi:hypothetical protein
MLEAQPASGSEEALSESTSDSASAGADLGDRIQVISSPTLSRLLAAAPVAVGVWLILSLAFGQSSLDDPMYVTGLLAVVVALAVFQGFARRIPDSFERLEARGVVQAVDKAKFRDFKKNTTSLLNHPIGIVCSAVFVVFALARFPVRAGGIDRFLGNGPGSLGNAGPLLLLSMLAEALLGLALGLVLWRMLIVALKVRELGDRFTLRLQVNHPDQCGGFRPLGDLCLWNALLVTVPAIYLGIWVVLAPQMPIYGTRYVELHGTFLAILAVLAPVTFVAPLWTIHGEMLRDATRLRAEEDQLGRQIDHLSRELLERSKEMTADEAAAVAHDLEIRQENYKRTDQIPTWPIDVSLALRFGTSQLIPLLGLTGLSKPIVDAIDRFGTFISSS